MSHLVRPRRLRRRVSASQRSRTDVTRPLWTHRTLNMVLASSYDARLAASPLLRNASYWRGTGTAWRDAAVGTDGGPRTSCGERLAFVTQLSGEPFVPLALCLARQLRAQGSVCPLLLVYDDVTEGRNLSRASLDLLKRDTVGSTRGDRLVPLSSLIARAYADPAVAWPLVPAEGPATSVPRSPSLSSDSGYQHQQLPPQPQPQHQHQHQRLASSQRKNRFLGAANKYWLWALTDYERLVRPLCRLEASPCAPHIYTPALCPDLAPSCPPRAPSMRMCICACACACACVCACACACACDQDHATGRPTLRRRLTSTSMSSSCRTSTRCSTSSLRSRSPPSRRDPSATRAPSTLACSCCVPRCPPWPGCSSGSASPTGRGRAACRASRRPG